MWSDWLHPSHTTTAIGVWIVAHKQTTVSAILKSGDWFDCKERGRESVSEEKEAGSHTPCLKCIEETHKSALNTLPNNIDRVRARELPVHLSPNHCNYRISLCILL